MKIIPIFFYHEKWAVIIRKFVYSPDGVEKMGPLRGDGNVGNGTFYFLKIVEKMGPLRGDGNLPSSSLSKTKKSYVEKMGPLRGDGNAYTRLHKFYPYCREDGSPSWGRKHPLRIHKGYIPP